jgi:hypothetical protein
MLLSLMMLALCYSSSLAMDVRLSLDIFGSRGRSLRMRTKSNKNFTSALNKFIVYSDYIAAMKL